MIRGAKGEDIEEPDDLDKELALLEKKLKYRKNLKVENIENVLNSYLNLYLNLYWII